MPFSKLLPRRSAAVALAAAIGLCLVSQVPSTAMASPIAMSNPQQNVLTRPAVKPVAVCGTVVGIDFTEEDFSVGFVNGTDQVELIRNKDGDIYTPNYVRIIDFQDGSPREVLFGKDALTRPLNQREEKLLKAMGEAVTKYVEENPIGNLSLPVPDIPDIHYQFQPDRAYGLGGFSSSTNLQDFYWKRPSSPFLVTEDGTMVVGDEWDNVSPRSHRGGWNATGECPSPTEAELEYTKKGRDKEYQRKLTVAGLLIGQAKELAEKRLREKVKFAVITVPSPVDMPHGTRLWDTTPALPYTEGLVRGGLYFLRVLEQSEAAVLAYEPQIAEAERAAGGRPQTVVFYYLNVYGEGIAVFETNRDPAKEDFLRLKTVAKYHFYQSVLDRMAKALARHVYEKYADGSLAAVNASLEDCEFCDWILAEDPSSREHALILLQSKIRKLSDDSRTWPVDDPENDAKEERLFISMLEYVVMTRKELRAFERKWLKTHFGAMLERAYETSGVEIEARPQRIDHFLIVDQSRYRNRTSSIMREVLGGSAELNELVDPAIEHKFGPIVSHGAARVANYLTKQSSLHSCL